MGSGPILLSGLLCNGSEDTLLACERSRTPESCDHSMDAGIRCEGEITSDV